MLRNFRGIKRTYLSNKDYKIKSSRLEIKLCIFMTIAEYLYKHITFIYMVSILRNAKIFIGKNDTSSCSTQIYV